MCAMESITHKSDILPPDIAPEDRAELEQGLLLAAEHHNLIAALSPAVQQAIIEMGAAYLLHDNYTYFKKLFKNALPYVAQGRIARLENGSFVVEGDTNMHYVTTLENGKMACDCDLFSGRGKFEGKGGECSHLQTAILLNIACST